jgi:uncharacterized membrane protein YhaH (DUF805 family)
MPYCTNCGADLASSNDVRYCTSCGTRVSSRMSLGGGETSAGMISPADAISTCFSKYVDFSGRATRAEYWWWVLIMGFGAIIVGESLNLIHPAAGSIVGVALLLPGLAVAVRRLHDIDKSGWWLLIALVPLIGWLVLIIFYAKRGSPGSNSYGPPA